MSRIHQPVSQPNEGIKDSDVKRLLDASKTLEIAPTEEKRPNLTYLARLKSIHRHPPALSLSGVESHEADPINAVISPELMRLSDMKMSDFAFDVAELAWRVESPVAGASDPVLLEGHAILSQTGRMFEHLHLLQTYTES